MRLSRRGLLLAVLVGAAATVAYVLPPGVAAGADYLQWQVFNRQYWIGAARELRLPLWNPHIGLGRPFLADIEAAALYPGTLVSLLGLEAGLVAAVFLHSVLAAAGMLLLAARMGVPLRAAALMAAGFVMGPLGSRLLAGQTGYVHAGCYLPLAFALAIDVQERPSPRGVALLAMTLGLQVLAGHPQMAWITWLGVGLFLAGRRLHTRARGALAGAARDLAMLAAAVGWALGAAAALLLPYSEFVARGNRGASSLGFASSFALPLASLHSLFVWPEPSIYAGLGSWENDLYSNALAVVAGLAALAVVRGRDATGMAVVLVVSLLLSVGRATPLFAAAYHTVPGLAVFRFPARIAGLAPFALIALSGLFLSEPGPGARHRRAVCVVAAAVAAGLLLWAPWHTGLQVGLGWLAARTLVCAAAAAALVWWTRAGWPSAACGLALLAVVAADAAIALRTRRAVAAADGAGAVPEGEAVLAAALRRPELRQEGGALPRVHAPLSALRYNAGVALGYSAPASYAAVALDRVWTFLHESIGVEPPLHNTGPSRGIFRHPFPYDTLNLAVGFEAASRRFVRATAPDPRAYLVPCAAPVADWREAVARVAGGHDVHRCALVEPGTPMPPRLHPGRAALTAFAPERIAVQVEAEGEALLVLAEPWYPGWEARAGGRALPCFPVNAWMRGALVPSGRHEVVFSYRSRLLGPGTALSVLSLGLAAIAVRRGRMPLHRRSP